MKIEAIKSSFRQVDRKRYPELGNLTRGQIYKGKMGPGGLFLATQMARTAGFAPGMRVMDLGCGKGATSVFVTSRYEVITYAVDLWVPADELFATVKEAHLENRVLPFNLDATKTLPFPREYFDAVFCMDAFHYVGAEPGFLAHIAAHLKPGAHVVIGNPCFDREFQNPPPPTYQAFWNDEFSRYHSPGWWKGVVEESGLFTDISAEEAQEGTVLWEDSLLDDIKRGVVSTERAEADADEIVLGQDHPEIPRLTHYILSCRKR